jgi:5-methylcytosine-specific restriction endonuclease McrA
MDSTEFLILFHDYLAPKLDTYEQAIYLYVIRHSRLVGLDSVTIGFKSARAALASGTGEAGKSMSETTVYGRVQSLMQKGCFESVESTSKGSLIKPRLPNEIENLIPPSVEEKVQDIEDMDFFNDVENRILILKRENYQCFYTLKRLTADNFVIDHVVSRPNGTNSYRNLVASSRQANNMKGATSAPDFLRRLYREGFISDTEFQDRLQKLSLLANGELKPELQ